MLRFVKGCPLIVVALFALQTFAAAAADPSVTNENYTLKFTNLVSLGDNYVHGFIVINGVEALQIGSIIYDNDEHDKLHFEADRAEVQGITVTVYYRAYHGNEKTSDANLSATYTCLPNVIEIEYHLTTSHEDYASGTMFECRPFDSLPAKTENDGELFKAGLWKRYKEQIDGKVNFGTSYEVKDGYFRNFINPYKMIMMKLEAKANEADWGSHSYQYIPFNLVQRKYSSDEREYSSKVEIFVYPGTLSKAGVAAAAAGDRDAAVEIYTAHPYNRFKPEDGAPELRVKVSNARSTPLEGDLTVTARTMDNEEILERPPQHVPLAGFDTLEIPVKFPQSETAPERELYFVEASFIPNTSGIEYFSRTNIAILPDFDYRHKAESVFGISDYFSLPDDNSALKLLKRLGVHHLRSSTHDSRFLSDFGIVANSIIDINPPVPPDNDYLTRSLKSCVAQGSRIVELGNECNRKLPIGTHHQEYCRWVNAAVGIRDSNNLPIKFLTHGISQWDEEYLEYLMGPDCCPNCFEEGIAFHPGRIGFTADADRNVLEGEYDCTNTDDYGVSYCESNYYGMVKKYMNFVRANNLKSAYSTEVYAGTWPNMPWRDSYRQAAANIVLSLALGLAEGLSSIQVYQLNDGILSDQYGIHDDEENKDEENKDDEEDKVSADEYHYGLLMRDLSLKPSAMAYAATAETLDGAKVSRPLIKRGSLRALVFDIDNNRRVTLLWNRSEGYVQAKENEICHAEPWLPSYTKKVPYRFIIAGSEVSTVQVVDIIGRRHNVKVVDGYVDLELSGEPIFVYDIDVSRSAVNGGEFLLLLE